MKDFPGGIYGITVRGWGMDHIGSAEVLLRAGVKMVQYREKSLSTREMIDDARKVHELCMSYGAVFIVNDRVDVAYASEADGVHLGQDDFPAELARRILGDAIVGVSASTPEEGVSAEKTGANYIGAGSIFPSKTKPEERVLGVDGLKRLISMVKLPVYAIGGIKLQHLEMLKNAGVYGIAVISEIFDSEDPYAKARSFVETWEKLGRKG